LRTADAVTPFLTARAATVSLVSFCAVYAFIFLFGTFYIYRLIRTGPVGELFAAPRIAVPNRPMSLANEDLIHERSYVNAGE
jgi:cytochrome d ubiquinol oxidase subunit I